MKKFLKFSGAIAFVLALVAFILMMATPAIMYKGEDVIAKGIVAIFGKKESISFMGVGLGTAETKLAWSALLAWIFILVSLIVLCLGIVLPLLKVKALEKYAGIMNLCAVILLVLAGIFMFITVPVFWTANGGDSVPNNVALGAGWIIGGILAILAGVVAILPAVADFLGKKK